LGFRMGENVEEASKETLVTQKKKISGRKSTQGKDPRRGQLGGTGGLWWDRGGRPLPRLSPQGKNRGRSWDTPKSQATYKKRAGIFMPGQAQPQLKVSRNSGTQPRGKKSAEQTVSKRRAAPAGKE